MEDARKESESRSERLEDIFAALEKKRNHLIAWDEKTVRQLLEYVKVLSGEKLLVIFKGGMEREVTMS